MFKLTLAVAKLLKHKSYMRVQIPLKTTKITEFIYLITFMVFPHVVLRMLTPFCGAGHTLPSTVYMRHTEGTLWLKIPTSCDVLNFENHK